MDVSTWIRHWARWSPERTALRFEGRDHSYRQLDGAVGRLAGALAGIGVGPGDRVAHLGPNTDVLLEALFATARLGAVFVPLNARMPAQELSVFLDDAEPRVLLAEAGFVDAAAAALDVASVQGARLIPFGGSPASDVLAALLDGTAALAPDRSVPSTAPVAIMYTSGTTGRPRGAVLTHEALLCNAWNARTSFGLDPTDVVLTNLPMFHVGGMNILTTPAISAGATVVVHRSFDPGLTLDAVEQDGVTIMVAVPTMTRALATSSRWPAADLHTLRCVLTGSTTVTDDVLATWRDRGLPLCQVYGLTETCPIATVVPPVASERLGATAGLPAMFCEVRVVDAAGGDVPRGEQGEIVLRGANVIREYWRNPEATASAFVDGWFRTGDAGFLDCDDVLHVVERVKDIVVVGGSNVYPADVEAVLLDAPFVREAAVVAGTDPVLGEVPVAVVALEPGETRSADDVLALFAGRLASYKHPHHVLFVDALPRTALGKVRKGVLREWVRTLTAADAPAGAGTG